MKKSLFVIAAGCVLVAGCNEKVELTPEVLGEGVYATLEQPDVLSTKSLDYADGKLSFSWANGDQLMVYGQSTSAILTVNEAEGGSANVTKLESPDFKLNDGATYYVFSPVAGTLSESTKDAVNVSFDNQRQVSNGSTAHLKSTQYACATATVKDNAVNFQLYNQGSWVRFSHKFPDGVTASKVVFTAEGAEDAFVHDGTLDTTSPVTEKGFATSITAVGDKSQYLDINLGEESSEGIDIASGDTLEVFVAVHPVDLTGKTLKVQVLDKSGKVLSTNEYAGRAIKRNAFVSFTDNSAKPTDVASVNGVGYAQLYEALWACENGETVKLLKDVEVGGLTLYSENDVVLDLNGKNLITTGEPGFKLDGATLTIKGSGVVGDTTQTKTDHLFDLVMGSTLTVEGDAEFYAQTDCIYAGIAGVNDTYINVKGGKWYAKESNGVYWTINKEDGKKEWIYISVTGGEFYKFNPAESHTENPVENWVAAGYCVVKDGDWYKVLPSVASVDGVGYTTVADAFEAIAESGTVKLLSDVTEDTGLFVGKGSKNITLDLSGHTLTTAGNVGSTGTQNQAFHFEQGNAICIKNGTIAASVDENAKTKFIIQNYADLTLEDVIVDAANLNYPGQDCYAVSNNSGNVVIKGNTSIVNVPQGKGKNFNFAMDAYKFSSYPIPTVTFETTGSIDGNIELSGGNIVLSKDLTLNGMFVGNYSGESSIDLNGHTLTTPSHSVKNMNATLHISNGTIISQKGVAVRSDGNSTVTTLTSCNVTGREGAIGIRSSVGSKMEISGCELAATDNAVLIFDGNAREGEANVINVENTAINGKIASSGYIACGVYAPWKDIITLTDVTMNIENGVGVLCRGGQVYIKGDKGSITTTGGDLTGWVGDNKNQIPCKSLYVDKAAGYSDAENAAIIVSGGSYSDDSVFDFVADGYCVSKSSSMYSVKKGETPATESELTTSLQSSNHLTIVDRDIIGIGKISSIESGTLHFENDAVISAKDDEVDAMGTSRGFVISGKGKIIAPTNISEANGVSCLNVNGGTTNIYGDVEFDGNSGSASNYAIRITRGTVNIYGGYFHSGLDKDGEVSPVIYLKASKYSTCNLNIYDGVFWSDGDASYLINCWDSGINYCKIKVYGGTFVGWNPADSEADKINGANANWVAEGYVSTKTTYNGKDAWVVTKK